MNREQIWSAVGNIANTEQKYFRCTAVVLLWSGWYQLCPLTCDGVTEFPSNYILPVFSGRQIKI